MQTLNLNQPNNEYFDFNADLDTELDFSSLDELVDQFTVDDDTLDGNLFESSQEYGYEAFA